MGQAINIIHQEISPKILNEYQKLFKSSSPYDIVINKEIINIWINLYKIIKNYL